MATPEEFFGGAWTGEGQVRGIGGRVLRSFTVTFKGAWSEAHRAFHTDETVVYADGRRLERHWVIHTDETGMLVGADNRAGRLRVQRRADGFRLRYDRPRGLGPAPGVSSLALDLRPAGAGRLNGSGVTRVLGLPLARTTIAFEQA